MNEMTDHNIDTLIRETLERRELLADLDRLIIADVRRQARREWIRRWARVAAFSFGLPIVLLVFAACMYLYIEQFGTSTFTLYIIALPTLALIFSTHRFLKNFSCCSTAQHGIFRPTECNNCIV